MPIIIGSTANEGNTFSFMNFMLKSQTEELHLNSLKKLAAAYEQFSPTISSLILTNYTSQNPKFSKSFVRPYQTKLSKSYFGHEILNILFDQSEAFDIE